MESAITSIQATRWRPLAAVVDFAALQGSALLVLLWAGRGQLSLHDAGFAEIYVASVALLGAARQLRGLRLLPSDFDSCLDAVRACSVGAMFTFTAVSLSGAGRPASAAVQLGLVSLGALCVARVGVGHLGRRARRRGTLMTPTLIVGAGVVGARIVRRLIDKPEYGLQPVGFLDADPMPGALDLAGVPILGGSEDLAAVCERTGARHVILTFASERDARLVELVNRCRELGLEVSVVPRLYESVNERATLDHIGGLPLLWLQAVNPKGWQFTVKHALDRVVALLALVALAPALIAIAIAVKLSSPGPVIFRQRRVGRDGRPFDVLKFRTMAPVESSKPFILLAGAAPGGVEGTDRRTGLGRWLRSTSLDELPQLVNVLRGDMSLVGPRPERPEFAEQFSREVHRYGDRHRVKSGITGWAQVNGLRGQTSIADRVEWDNHYIENWSLGLELRTIALTLAEVVRFREDTSEREQQPRETQPPAVARPALSLIQAPEEIASAIWFCGYCGDAPATGATPAPVARVCGSCGQGVMLETRPEAAPRREEAFLVLDSSMTVQAVSQRAERVLGVSEEEATDRPVAEFLVGADAESGTQESLAAILARAASSEDGAESTFVRPRDTFGVRLRARISVCGPPRAVLIVFESAPTDPSQPPHLRLVPATELRVAEPA